jgi:hypothetical protein
MHTLLDKMAIIGEIEKQKTESNDTKTAFEAASCSFHDT